MELASDTPATMRQMDADAALAADLFRNFVMSFTVNEVAVYRKDALMLVMQDRNTLFVDFGHLASFSPQLANLITQKWYRVHESIADVLVPIIIELEPNREKADIDALKKKRLHVAIEKYTRKQPLRELRSSSIGHLVRISGQVVRTYPVHPELCYGCFNCVECNAQVGKVPQQFKYTQPLQCPNSLCQNRAKFKLDLRLSVFTDFQKVRIQEMQNELPRGSVPRSMDVIVRGECVERCQPGDRFDFTGTLIAVPDVAQISFPGAKAYNANARRKGAEGYEVEGVRGLKSLGVRDLNFRLAFLASSMCPIDFRLGGDRWFEKDVKTPDLARELVSDAEFTKICDMRSSKNLYKDLINSLFPTIYGNDEIKRGILLMLFGGVPKRTLEGTTLRGDINICIVGDPSTAKSQFLRQVQDICPRAVYTNGRTSSAAGLTAAVVRDEESFEFVIEAGALMLADNGICCIDEFDKMETKDQVAIHEAMEQQTISITKAGVKATLNARTSILAAANPIGGQYDRAKSLRQNINLSAPILSRFDLFFILIDEGNEAVDYAVAQRIVDLHVLNFNKVRRHYSVEDIKRYIMFARLWMPKLSEEAAECLVENYKRLRLRDSVSAACSSWRITVRQLESMIRLSEAVARMYCSDVVLVKHVQEAARLLNKSIIRVEQPDVDLDAVAMQAEELDGAELEEAQSPETDTLQRAPLRISFEEYKRIASMLVMHLRAEEEKAETMRAQGVRTSDLVSWFLEEISDDIESEEELYQIRDKVEKIIKRLVHHDNVLISLSGGTEEDMEEADRDDPFLVVHPSYVLEEE